MTVIIRDIPGMSGAEVLEALRDIRPKPPVETGHGGFVVDERTALEFLRAYSIVMWGEPAVPSEPTESPEATVEPLAETVEPEPARRRTTKRGARP